MSSEDTASLVDAAFAILHEVPHNSHVHVIRETNISSETLTIRQMQVLVIEHPHRDISQRMSTLEYLFERETAAAVGFAYSGVAGLFGYDVRTGICVDVGAGVTQGAS
jgi:actin-related protein